VEFSGNESSLVVCLGNFTNFVHFPHVHGVSELLPKACAESDSSFQIFLIEVNLDVADFDTGNFWNDNSSLEKDVEIGNTAVNGSLEES